MSLNPPSHSNEVHVSFPADNVLLLTLNRPKFLNAMTPRMENDINTLLNWFENEPSLWHVLLFCILPFQGGFICTLSKGLPLSRGKDVHFALALISKRELLLRISPQYVGSPLCLDGMTINKKI
jgi:hypothetical protein